MSRTQIQQAVVVLLLVAFGAVWLLTRSITPKKTETPTLAVTAGPMAPAAPKPKKAMEEHLPESSAPLKSAPKIERDPFQLPPLLAQSLRRKLEELERQQDAMRAGPIPADQANVQLPTLVIQGIFWGTSNPQVLINRKVLGVGDQVDGAEIVAVKRDGITVSYGGRTYDVTMPETTGRSGGVQ